VCFDSIAEYLNDLPGRHFPRDAVLSSDNVFDVEISGIENEVRQAAIFPAVIGTVSNRLPPLSRHVAFGWR